MIFFRTLTVPAVRHDRKAFVQLKAFFMGEVDELSGMVVNLQDVDQWMKDAVQLAPSVSTFEEVLEYYFENLQSRSSLFQKLQMRVGGMILQFDGQKFSYTYLLKTWFSENENYVQKRIRLGVTKPLSLKWRQRFPRKKWSRFERLAEILELHLPGIISLEVERK